MRSTEPVFSVRGVESPTGVFMWKDWVLEANSEHVVSQSGYLDLLPCIRHSEVV